MSLHCKEYAEYLNSKDWKALKSAAFERDGDKCVKCGSNNKLVGHHIKYPKDIYLCPVEYVQTLCEKCHNELHKNKAREESKIKKLNKNPIDNQYLTNLLSNFSASDNNFLIDNILKIE